MTIDHLDFPTCERDATHGEGTLELVVAKHDTKTVLVLCDACADRIHPQNTDCGITITLQPIGGWT